MNHLLMPLLFSSLLSLLGQNFLRTLISGTLDLLFLEVPGSTFEWFVIYTDSPPPPPNTPGTCPLLHDFRSFVPGVHGNLLGTVTSVLVAVLLNEIAVNPCQCFAFLTFIILDALC